MEVFLKVLLLLALIILPLFKSRTSKRTKDTHREEPQSKSNYGVAEGGFITLIDNQRKQIKDKKPL